MAACRKGLLLCIQIFLRAGHGGHVWALVVQEGFEGHAVLGMVAMAAGFLHGSIWAVVLPFVTSAYRIRRSEPARLEFLPPLWSLASNVPHVALDGSRTPLLNPNFYHSRSGGGHPSCQEVLAALLVVLVWWDAVWLAPGSFVDRSS